MARKGILSTDIPSGTRKPVTAKPATPARGTVGALQSSLNKLQENAIQDVDAALIDDAGVEDRLGFDGQAHTQLKESLQTYGQQVPLLLRPHSSKPGRYEIVYGRRRLRALKELGMPVKAMVRQLDDHALVMAQGQENTSRKDLSFIEKASFAAQLQDLGYDRKTIAAALSIDMPMVSRMLKIGTAFPIPFLKQIGSAPAIGRDRWAILAKVLEGEGAMNRVTTFMKTPDFANLNTNDRFEAALKRATPPKPAKAAVKARTVRGTDGAAIADIRQTGRGVTLTIPSRTADGFGTWINTNADSVLADLHDRWMAERSDEN